VIVPTLVNWGYKRNSGAIAVALEFQGERHIRNMRLKLILPVIEPGKYENPAACPRTGCKGQRFLIF
jgi:hypothetical protein